MENFKKYNYSPCIIRGKNGKQKDQQLSGVDKQQRVQVLEGSLGEKTERGL